MQFVRAMTFRPRRGFNVRFMVLDQMGELVERESYWFNTLQELRSWYDDFKNDKLKIEFVKGDRFESLEITEHTGDGTTYKILAVSDGMYTSPHYKDNYPLVPES